MSKSYKDNQMKKIGAALAGAMIAGMAMTVQAEAPSIRLSCSLNGRVYVVLNGDYYDSLSWGAFTLQGRRSDSDDWTNWTLADGNANTSVDRPFWKLKCLTTAVSDIKGVMQWRLARNDTPDEWAYFTTDSASPVVGSCYDGGNFSGNDGSRAFDGVVDTYYLTATYEQETKWAGIDLGEPKLIGGIKACVNDAGGAVIQYANAADFSDAVTIAELDADECSADMVCEKVFSQPVMARYWRILCNDGGQWFSVWEVELDEAFYVVNGDDKEHFPCVRFSTAVSGNYGARIYRSSNKENGYTAVAEVESGATEYVDYTASFGKIYYKIYPLDENGGELELCPTIVEYVRSHQIERDTRDLSVLNKGFTAFAYAAAGSSLGTGHSGAIDAFDGNASTYPNYWDEAWGYYWCYNVAVGVDCGEGNEAYLTSWRVLPCGDWVSGRSANLTIYGCNNAEDIGKCEHKIGEAVPSSVWNIWYEMPAIDSTGYRYIYVCQPTTVWADTDRPDSWCGNVAELQFFGWTKADLNAQPGDFKIPTAADGASGITLDFSKSYSMPNGVAILRSTEENGHYAEIGRCAAGATKYTDIKVKVGITYWYRLARLGQDGAIIETSNVRKSSVIYRRLERSESESVLDPTCSVVFSNTSGAGYQAESPAELSFDGDVSTFPGFYEYIDGWHCYNPAIGIDFGDDSAVVVKARIYMQSNGGRSTGLVLYGSDEMPTFDSSNYFISNPGTAVSAPLKGIGQMWIELDCTSDRAYRYYYLTNPNGGPWWGDNWCGELCEMQLFGYRKSDAKIKGLVIVIK